MPKRKPKLDRKTRRAIEQMVRQQMVAGSKPAKASTTFSLNSLGHISSLGSSGWSTKSAGASLNSASSKQSKPPVELPAISGQLHVSKHFIDEISFHMDVVRAHLPHLDFTLVQRATKEDHELSFEQLAFYSADALEEFETWLARYLEKFGKHVDLVLPPPVDGVYPHTVRSNFERRAAKSTSLSKATSNVCSDTWDQERLEQWLWILENCEGEVRHAGSFWFFVENGDATLFKMAYS